MKCIVKLDRQEVPALDSGMVYRYPGIQMGARSTQPWAVSKLHDGLTNR